ncbi:MAG: hypothetical protein SH868_11830 [Bythopirellula sp.]|nr:hypothetical protein [Bythopirellula sp.]
MRACRRHDFQILLFLLLVCSARVWANEAENPIATERVAAIAADVPPVPTPQDVAREVLRLQEEMGGSIVSDFQPEPAWNAPPTPPPVPHPWRPAVSSPVLALRETAWQLEQSAHLLESLDLYSQADALRETADRLHKDARKLKGNGTTKQAK